MKDRRYRQMLHARLRAWEHFKLVVSDADLEGMVRVILSGGSLRARYCCEARDGRQVWVVGHGRGTYPVIFDPYTEMVATFLPDLSRFVEPPPRRPRRPRRHRLNGKQRAARLR